MHSHLKGKKEDFAVAAYCPLDLFSGDQTRVRKALEELWGAWIGSRGKVNNLRIFVEGEIVDPGDPPSVSRLAALFPDAHLDTPSLSDLLQPFVEALLPLLIETPLLSTLSRLQRTLDPLDIEGLSKLWSHSHPGSPLGEGEPDPSLEEWDGFVRTYLSSGGTTLRYSILAYLLSATFKDCSIILRPGKDGGKGTITAIDLDPKSVSRLTKWEALDQEIVKNFTNIAEKREACVDTWVGSLNPSRIEGYNVSISSPSPSCCGG